MTAIVFPTCLVELVRPEITGAVIRVLGDAKVANGTTCCGQPAFNAGYVDDARRVARTTARALAKTDGPIVVPSGSCAAMMTHYWPELLGDSNVSERVVEFSAYLTRSPGDSPRAKTPISPGERVAYHDSCHMLRVLGIKAEPREVLGGEEHVAELSERCCGFGGTFSVKLPEVSTAMADEKLDEVVATGCTTLVGCDLSCLMHLGGRAGRRGLDLEVKHLAEVLENG